MKVRVENSNDRQFCKCLCTLMYTSSEFWLDIFTLALYGMVSLNVDLDHIQL